jgi:hypothetical protein
MITIACSGESGDSAHSLFSPIEYVTNFVRAATLRFEIGAHNHFRQQPHKDTHKAD